MAKIIKNGAVHDDAWQVLRLAESETPQSVTLPEGPLLVPLAVWQERRAELIARRQQHGWPLGVWLAPSEGPENIAAELKLFDVIGIDFPKFADGRGYSTARLLRERHGYDGELRCIGDIQRDQLFYLQRVGFDAFAVRTDHDITAALSSLHDFSAAYQASTDQHLQLQRRTVSEATGTN
jgi:uncharacterized protein (DUF934 family)